MRSHAVWRNLLAETKEVEMSAVSVLPEASEQPDLILDRVLPVSDATSSHRTIVAAPPERVWAALQALDLVEVLRSSPVARALIAMRAVPVKIADRLRGRPPAPAPERYPLVEAYPWVVLGTEEPRELVVGAIGRFWGPGVEWLDIQPAEFVSFDRPAWGKIAWGFTILPYGDGRSLLVDECRTRVTDSESRRRFKRYWKLAGPGASYVMGRSLTLVKRHAEEGRAT
jgi:hypothetical protein